jgi:diacylglycerol kinase (CTP)
MSTADTWSRLSWADTSASTFGRLWGKKTRALPRSFLGLPFSPRKSLAGFIAASLTGSLAAVAFWGWFAPSVNRPEVSWTWVDGFSASSTAGDYILDNVNQGRMSPNFSGWMGLGIIGIFAGLVSGVAEALGDSLVCILLNFP